MAKEYAKPFYNSKEWQKVRQYILMRDKYKCTICGDTGDLEVHHKEHITPENIFDTNITLNEKNLTTLCRECHMREHDKDRHKANICGEGYYFDENGYLIQIK